MDKWKDLELEKMKVSEEKLGGTCRDDESSGNGLLVDSPSLHYLLNCRLEAIVTLENFSIRNQIGMTRTPYRNDTVLELLPYIEIKYNYVNDTEIRGLWSLITDINVFFTDYCTCSR